MYIVTILPCPYRGREVSAYRDGSGYCHTCHTYFPAFSYTS